MGELVGKSSRLWTCYRCELIGPRTQALEHSARTGHAVVELDDGTSASVRALWRAEGDPRGDVDSSLMARGEVVDE